MDLTITLQPWMLIPAMTTLVAFAIAAGLALASDLNARTFSLLIQAWAATTLPALAVAALK